MLGLHLENQLKTAHITMIGTRRSSLEKAAPKRAKLRDKFKLLGTVWGIGGIL